MKWEFECVSHCQMFKEGYWDEKEHGYKEHSTANHALCLGPEIIQETIIEYGCIFQHFIYHDYKQIGYACNHTAFGSGWAKYMSVSCIS